MPPPEIFLGFEQEKSTLIFFQVWNLIFFMGEVRTYLLDLKKMYCRPEKIIVPQTRICVLGFEINPV